MSARKRRGARAAPKPPHDKKALPFDSPNMSSIDGISFLQGLQQNDGNRMHSTAIEEDLKPSKEARAEKGRVGKNNLTQKAKNIVKTRPKKSDSTKQATSSPAKPTKRRVQKTSAAGPLNDEQVKTTQMERSVSGSGEPSNSEEEPDFGTKRRRNIILSSDENTDEDVSWNPSPPKSKKAKMHSLERSQKTSSGQKTSSDKDLNSKKKRERSQGGTELEAMLDAFLDFCDEYRDSVASTAVTQSIDSFSTIVKEQLLEKIASCKELKAIKRENAKVDSMIRTKRHRLLDAKQELIRAERQVGLLQKEKADLQLRLDDLKRSRSFLRDLGELNKIYLDYRRAHPKQKETYGASSVAALLLETKRIQGTEQQPRSINKHLVKRDNNNRRDNTLHHTTPNQYTV
uniref:centromere protein U isoform X2 n=1 Tax=Doryrhamphus excisus TaxID=161450 RepID=UPI0025ADAB5C|nr:centromere protein U isoform X2 [Doryrhamphus excisus]